MTVYMVVTADEFELPVIVSDKVQDIATFFGKSKDTIHCAILRDTKVSKKFKVIKFVDDDVDTENERIV